MAEPGLDRRREQLAANLAVVERRIAAACAAAGRPRDEVTLVVVTKTYPASDVGLLSGLGVVDVAENRDQGGGAESRGMSEPRTEMAFCRPIADK